MIPLETFKNVLQQHIHTDFPYHTDFIVHAMEMQSIAA
jgi:hypothetical protein